MSNKPKWGDALKDDVVWYSDGNSNKPKLLLAHRKILKFLSIHGFNSLKDSNDRRARYQLIQTEDLQIKAHNLDTIRTFIYEYFEDKPDEWWIDKEKYGVEIEHGLDMYWTKDEVLDYMFDNLKFKESMIDMQVPIVMKKPYTYDTIPLMKDVTDEVFIPFMNKIIRVTATSIDAIDYTDMKSSNSLIWETQKRPFNISVIDDERKIMDSHFAKFCRKATSPRVKPKNSVDDWRDGFQESADILKSLMTSYGYMISNYNNPSTPVCPVYIDGDAEIGLEDGRNGKSFIMLQSMQKWKQTVEISGRSWNPTANGCWGQVNIDTKFICINDARENFQFEELYDRLSDGFEVKALYSNKFTIPRDKKPKIGITTNYQIQTKGGSGRHRIHTTPFGAYWLNCLEEREQPSDKKHLGKMMFEHDFTHDDYNHFFNFGFRCIQSYLKYGLHRCDLTEQNKKAIIRKYEGSNNYGVVEWWIDLVANNKVDGLLVNGVRRTDLLDRFHKDFSEEECLATKLLWGSNPDKFNKMLYGVTTDMGWDWNPHKADKGDGMNKRKWIGETTKSGKQIQWVKINKD